MENSEIRYIGTVLSDRVNEKVSITETFVDLFGDPHTCFILFPDGYSTIVLWNELES